MAEYEFGKRVYKQVIVDGKKMGKWVVFGEVHEFDENGNQIHYVDMDEKEWWKEYDTDGKCVHEIYGNGREIWTEYDSNGGIISSKNNDGDSATVKNQYDSNKKLIHKKVSDGSEVWIDRDENGKVIHRKATLPNKEFEEFREYDEKGNVIYSKVEESTGLIKEKFCEYDENNRLIHEKFLTDDELIYEDFYERNDNGTWIHKKSIREGNEINFWAEVVEEHENGKCAKKFIYKSM